MFYARRVGLVEDVAYPLKLPLLLKQQGHIQGKQKAMNQMPRIKQYSLWRARKVSLFHTPSKGLHQSIAVLRASSTKSLEKNKH